MDTPKQNYYRILSLDGGGSWALIQANALFDIYSKYYGDEVRGHQVLSNFDYAGANSGGSIVLAGLLLDWPLKQMIDFFNNESERKKIFASLPFYRRLLHSATGMGPKYFSSKKLAGFKEVFKKEGDLLLEDLHTLCLEKNKQFPHVLITAFDYYRKRAIFCRSDIHSKAKSGLHNSVSLTHSVHAASNAPVNYFNRPAIITFGGKDKKTWDGAVGGNNNPVLAIYTEVISNIQTYNPEKLPIAILSIGTSSDFLPIKGETRYNSTSHSELLIDPAKPWLLPDIKLMATSILQNPPDTASYVVYRMLQYMGNNEENNLVRLNPMIQPELLTNPGTKNREWYLPGSDPLTGATPAMEIDQFIKLSKMDMDAVEQDDVDLINILCSAWLQDKVQNQPIQTDENLDCKLGQRKYRKDALPLIEKLFIKGTEKPAKAN